MREKMACLKPNAQMGGQIYIRNQARSVLQIDSIVFSFLISLDPHEDTSDNILQEVELLRGIFKAKFNLDCTIQAAATLYY